MDNVKDYVDLVKAPWGRMFYDLLFMQLNIPRTTRLNILDFGSGLAVTANYYAEWHNVTALELNPEMIENRHKENKYNQINGGVDKLANFQTDSFDYVLCHNVLEYIEEKEPVISELMRLLKPGGIFSIIKHNRVGRVFHSAVFWNDPQKALSLLDSHANDKSNYLGTQYIYSNADVAEWAEEYGGKIEAIYGMRMFWALGQDNSVKYTDDWYKNMLMLESKVASIDEYKNAAFFNHLLIIKGGERL